MRTVARRAAVTARAVADETSIKGLMRRLAPVLPTTAPRKVAVLARADAPQFVKPWLGQLAGDNVHVIFDRVPRGGLRGSQLVARNADELTEVLHRLGTMDLLVDLRGGSIANYTKRWAAAAFYLRAGGLYIVRPSALRRRPERRTLVGWAALLAGAEQVDLGKKVSLPPGLDPDVTGGTLVFSDALVVVKKHSHLLFVPDDQVHTVPSREPRLRLDVLAELPAGILHSNVKLTSHESTSEPFGLPVEFPYPRLQLRHYEGHIEFSGQTLLVSGHTILPDSHRFYRKTEIDHPLAPNWPSNPQFGTRAPLARPRRKLDGDYYLLDPQFTGHYGHLLTEAIPRLWGWDQAKATFPDLKVLTKVKPGRKAEPVLDRLLTAYGIDPDDIVYVDHPVELESVITASAMWHNFPPHFAHPDLMQTWDRIGAQLIDPDAPNWERIFLTRRPGTYRTCHNAPDVEALFESYGFQILRPEEYDLGVQAGFFRNARIIAGFSGSQMFNMMYTRDLEQLIILAQESYTARNEHLYGALLARNEDWFWSVPDKAWFHADWSFDFERNSAALEKLLGSL